jgi:hypothetical protein
MGKVARQFVLDHHDWAAMLAPMEQLLDLQAAAEPLADTLHAA